MSHRTVEHTITVPAPADVVYRLIADVANWPRIFPPSVHVEYVERHDTEERIQIWATANGDAKTWTSRRVLDPGALRVEFRQEKSQSPVASMGGAWVIEPASPSESRVRLLHDYRAEDDDPAKLAWLDKAVDRNSRAELDALRDNVAVAAGTADLLLTFEDTLRINGPVEAVYDFINDGGRWQERLPHVARAVLREDTPGLQILEMDTRTKDGGTHTTKSVRVCFPHHRIVYKQTEVPPLMKLHTGQWLLSPDGAGVAATSAHTVVIDRSNVPRFLGADATVADAKKFVRDALGTNSRTTLRHAKAHAEAFGG